MRSSRAAFALRALMCVAFVSACGDGAITIRASGADAAAAPGGSGGVPATGGSGGEVLPGGSGGVSVAGGSGGEPAPGGSGGVPTPGGSGGSGGVPTPGGSGGQALPGSSGGSGGAPAPGGSGGAPVPGGSGASGGEPAPGGSGGVPAPGGTGGSGGSGASGGEPAPGGSGGEPAPGGSGAAGGEPAPGGSGGDPVPAPGGSGGEPAPGGAPAPVVDAGVIPAADPPPALPANLAAGLLTIDDAEWTDPTLEGLAIDLGPEPPGSVYGVLPVGWEAAAAERYGAGNTPRSILTMGDSISESQAFIAEARWDPTSGVSLVEGYTHLSKDLATMAGQESRWGAAIANEALDLATAEVATVLFGTNDARHGYELPAYEANMRTIIEASLAHGTLPILMTPPPLNGSAEPVAELAQMLTALALEYAIPLFDLQRFLVDRGRLAQDLPDGIHPDYDAYMAINAEWIRFYKRIEWGALTVLRPDAPVADPYAADHALVWDRVFDRRFDAPGADPLAGLDIAKGRWEVVPTPLGGDAVPGFALVGTAARDDSAILRLPVRVSGPVRVEITAASDGGEISVIARNAGDVWGVDGWYFGYGTNLGARTGVVFQDTLLAELPDVRPEPRTWEHVRVRMTPGLAQWGTGGDYRLTYPLAGEGARLRPENDQVGLYVWSATTYILRVVVWAGRAP
jgi:lysophospholipase L1-like esterase